MPRHYTCPMHPETRQIEPGACRRCGTALEPVAGVLFPFTGLLLNPMIGAAAMSASSVSVVMNALRLRSASL